MKYFIHRLVSVIDASPITDWSLVKVKEEELERTVNIYRAMNTEPDPYRREVIVIVLDYLIDMKQICQETEEAELYLG